jgi:hypothetical protein
MILAGHSLIFGQSVSKRFAPEVFRLWYFLISERSSFTDFYDEQLLQCDADWWIPCVELVDRGGRAFTMLMFVVSHNQVSRILRGEENNTQTSFV